MTAPDSAVVQEQRELQTALIERVTEVLRVDARVDALWLGGSLGRGEGDWLSDVDLVVVAAPGAVETLLAHSGRVISQIGSPAVVHEARQNAPVNGVQLNVLYDTNPLPMNVDWNFWPSADRRPNDVRVLYEPAAFDAGGTFEHELSKMELGEGGLLADRPNGFLFMAPIVAKFAARGWFDSVDRCLEYMHLEPAPNRHVGAVIARLHDVVDDAAEGQPDEAVVTTRRYLRTLAAIMAN
jgi:predicted nucleotidyltransferase